MTNVQVFKWFCKEQKIMHLLLPLFYKIHPYKTEYTLSGGFERKYTTFEEYISDKVNYYGFFYLMDRLIDDYYREVRMEMSFGEFYSFREKNKETFEKICDKWNYFAKHNILRKEDSIKVGDIVRVKYIGTACDVKILNIDILSGQIFGELIDGTNRHYSLSFGNIIGINNGIMINYAIKRNRKIYNGKN